MLDTCVQLQNYDVHIDIAVVREPVYVYLRQHCNSFATVGENRKNMAMKLVLLQSRVPGVGEKRIKTHNEATQ